MKKYKLGIWSTVNDLVCTKCLNITQSEYFGEHELEEGNAISNCDRCNCEIQYPDNRGAVTAHNFALKLNKAGINAKLYEDGFNNWGLKFE